MRRNMTPASTTNEVRRSVEVAVGIDRAWAVFTEEMGTWWPLATHSIGADGGDAAPDGVVVEGRVGGSVYETIGDDRREWGTVAEWEPPRRLAVDWVVGGEVTTRWTATFTATPRGTKVELVHSGFEAHGERAATLVDAYGSDDGWTRVLGRFADVAGPAREVVSPQSGP